MSVSVSACLCLCLCLHVCVCVCVCVCMSASDVWRCHLPSRRLKLLHSIDASSDLAPRRERKPGQSMPGQLASEPNPINTDAMPDVGSIVWVIGSALFAVLLASAMGLFNRKNHMPVEGKTILLTGASEGMGRSVAIKLAARGANIIAVARNVERLEALLPDLRAAAKNPSTQRFHTLSADVGVPDFAAPLLAEATAWNNGLAPDIVWCIAGMSTPGLFAETPFAHLRRNMDVNFYGTAELAHAALGLWLAPDAPRPRTKKRFVMTSSVAAFCPIAGYSPYVPSKVVLRGLADALSQELHLYPDNPVAVHAKKYGRTHAHPSTYAKVAP
ncbi:3-ketodihydrosphingosine reductase tsc10 [Verticillium alfalfae VaMs.102]|uniref:3-ketodihydrosphingosine reductase tsc10 n=1 Tax=Verticillium alfalfae (strain VaMs.102 / ATCC MYA-4576 / FGSC 10136) TaxID=526221 RepID=C9SPS6_VERA1|nr:3-ketodihydrosphingosine reductase tsc10 [Verticillium alfalfae VaMs.102]EEY20791.1 3-ketodihydrosphingosine reductase tsc10 [Verticillium alfalfae VaMs.102]